MTVILKPKTRTPVEVVAEIPPVESFMPLIVMAKEANHRVLCDRMAIGEDGHLYLVSFVGFASQAKSVAALLNSRNAAEFTTGSANGKAGDKGKSFLRIPGGYSWAVAKLGYGRVHAQFVSRAPGFLPCISDEAVWQELKTSRYTTPILRQWMPYLRACLIRDGQLVFLGGHQTQCGLLTVTTEQLDSIVAEGLQSGEIHIPGHKVKARSMLRLCDGLDGFFAEYGPALADAAQAALRPLHVPCRDPIAFDRRPYAEGGKYLRQPYEAQAHVATAASKVLDRQGCVFIIGEQGVGKTLIGTITADTNAGGRPYRGLVICPDHLLRKWGREIEATIAGVQIRPLKSWRDVLDLVPESVPFRPKRWPEPDGPIWYTIGRDRAKLGAGWQTRLVERTNFAGWSEPSKDADGRIIEEGGKPIYQQELSCPRCGAVVKDKYGIPLARAKLSKSKRLLKCQATVTRLTGKRDEQPIWEEVPCGEPFYQDSAKPYWRYAPERIINKKLRKFFDYVILDEMHEAKSSETAVATSAGAIASASGKTIAMTGTLIGGYANHLFPLTMRLAPRTLIREGFTWEDSLRFSREYGRVDRIITCKEEEKSNKTSRGGGERKEGKEVAAPGIMPTLYGRHVMDKAVFLSLEQLGLDLPPYEERLFPVPMDSALAGSYKDLIDTMEPVVRSMGGSGDMRFLGSYLESLLYYPDHPFDWPMLGYMDKKQDIWIDVVQPKDLDPMVGRVKEHALTTFCLAEQEQGNQVWLYVQRTKKRDMLKRLAKVLEASGLHVACLRSKVPRDRREEWIELQGRQVDVMISHPQLVETGLDLFSTKRGGHNYSTIAWYQTGYRTFTLRQASRRAWRISQTKPCKVAYFYYEATLQEQAMKLMGLKLKASLGLEGKFSEEGLAAMNADGGSDALELARMLTKQTKTSAADLWGSLRSTIAANPNAVSRIIPPAIPRCSQTMFSFSKSIDR